MARETEKIDPELLRSGKFYDEDYFEHGAEKKISNYHEFTYANYRGHWESMINLILLNCPEVFNPLIYAGSRSLLDVGCAKGHFLKSLKDSKVIRLDAGGRLCGIDISRYAIDNGVDEPDIEMTHDSVLHIPYPDKDFDIVTCFDLLEHIPYPDTLEAIQQVCRVSKEFVVIFMPVWTDDDHYDQSAWSTDRTHVAVFSRQWWIDHFKEHGFKPVVVLRFDNNMFFIFGREDREEQPITNVT